MDKQKQVMLGQMITPLSLVYQHRKIKKLIDIINLPDNDLIKEITIDPEPQLLQEESDPEVSSKMTKQQYLDSIGMGHRPNSQRAIDAWESYQAS